MLALGIGMAHGMQCHGTKNPPGGFAFFPGEEGGRGEEPKVISSHFK